MAVFVFVSVAVIVIFLPLLDVVTLVPPRIWTSWPEPTLAPVSPELSFIVELPYREDVNANGPVASGSVPVLAAVKSALVMVPV